MFFGTAIAVVELRKVALFRATAEACERAQSNIFFIGRPPRLALKLLACQTDQALEVTFPELLRSRGIAHTNLADPIGNRPRGRHRFHHLKIV